MQIKGSNNVNKGRTLKSFLYKYFIGLSDHKWVLLMAYYFYFDLGQEIYELNSDERISFYCLNLAAWFFVFSLYMWKDGPKLMPNVDQDIFKGITLVFAWDLGDHIFNNGDRIFRLEAFQVSFGFFIFLAVNYLWGYFFGDDLLTITSKPFKRLYRSIFKAEEQV